MDRAVPFDCGSGGCSHRVYAMHRSGCGRVVAEMEGEPKALASARGGYRDLVAAFGGLTSLTETLFEYDGRRYAVAATRSCTPQLDGDGEMRCGPWESARGGGGGECGSAPDGTCSRDWVVQLATVDNDAAPDFEYPGVVAALGDMASFPGARLVEARRTERRFAAAIVPNKCQALKMVDLVRERLHSKPFHRCEQVDIVRPLTPKAGK